MLKPNLNFRLVLLRPVLPLRRIPVLLLFLIFFLIKYVTLNKVILDLGDNNKISSDTNWGEKDDSEHNIDVDKELAQRVIWNVPNASYVKFQETAGVFLLPNPANTVI